MSQVIISKYSTIYSQSHAEECGECLVRYGQSIGSGITCRSELDRTKGLRNRRQAMTICIYLDRTKGLSRRKQMGNAGYRKECSYLRNCGQAMTEVYRVNYETYKFNR